MYISEKDVLCEPNMFSGVFLVTNKLNRLGNVPPLFHCFDKCYIPFSELL